MIWKKYLIRLHDGSDGYLYSVYPFPVACDSMDDVLELAKENCGDDESTVCIEKICGVHDDLYGGSFVTISQFDLTGSFITSWKDFILDEENLILNWMDW